MEPLAAQPSQMTGAAMQGSGALQSSKMPAETKRKIYYAIGSFVFMALLGASGYFVDRSPSLFYWSFCLLFLGLGLLHYFLMSWLKLFTKAGAFAPRMLFSMIIVLLGMIAYALSFYFLSHHSAYTLYFSLSIAYLLVPLAVMRTFDLAMAVPPKDFKQWHYPSKPIVVDMDRIDTSNFAIITYVFSKKHTDIEKSNLQSKAPYDLRLGDLFYFFIQEWNYKYPQANIEYTDADHRSFGWLFYVKEKWWQPGRFLDPEKTIRDNNILVNQIIQTLRVPQDKPETES